VAENSSHLINSRYAIIVISTPLYTQLMQQRKNEKETKKK